METNSNLIQEVITEYNQLPPETKDPLIYQILNWVLKAGVTVDTGKKLWNIYQTNYQVETINQIISHIRNFSTEKVAEIKELCEKCNVEEIKDICAPLFYKPPDCKPDKLISCLNRSQSEIAKDVIRNSAMISFLLIAIQIGKLLVVWRDIARANNIVEESKKVFPEINEKISELRNGIVEIHKEMQEIDELNLSEETFERARDVNDRIGSLICTYVETILLISDVKIKIGNNIQLINLRKNDQIMDGISNAAQGVSNLLQYVTLGDSVSTGWKWVQGITTAAFFGLAVANARAYVITSKTLETLQNSMAVIATFEHELKKLREQIKIAEKWYKDIRETMKGILFK